MTTVLLLVISNTFMTFAWYGHLKHKTAPIVEAILVSWLIALGEYCFQVPANRIGYGRFTGYQLKIIQECVTLSVFVVFAYLYMGEPVRWNYILSFVCILGAVFFASPSGGTSRFRLIRDSTRLDRMARFLSQTGHAKDARDSSEAIGKDKRQ